jgi:hypothetical protein
MSTIQLNSTISSQASLGESSPILQRSVFTDHGPITKPALTLQSGSTAVINNPTKLTMVTASFSPAHVGLYVRLAGTLNAGEYRIVSRVSATSITVNAHLTLPDASNGTIGWELYDPRDGLIADDPSDVVVRINGTPVVPEAVMGLLGQVVLSVEPELTDQVEIDYAWIKNPTVDILRLNSQEFRLNNWNRDVGLPNGPSQHRYRYNNVLISPETYVTLDTRSVLAQPLQRDMKYRAYERAYSTALNDPQLLLLNSPNHRIAFPPMSRLLESSFVNYQTTVLPESDLVAPWEKHGVGTANIVGTDLVVQDTSVGPFPTGEPIFWTRELDLTFDHVFAIAWRVKVSADTSDGVFTGVMAGYADDHKAVIIGYLEDSGVKKIGVLKTGHGNDHSTISAWAGGLDSTGSPNGLPVAVDWSSVRSYRVFRSPSGVISVYVDGSVVPTLQVTADDLPFLEELNAPFDELQGVYFGSLSREASNTSTWSFVRYTTIPLNPMQSVPSTFVSYEASDIPENSAQPWTPVGFHGTETVKTNYLLLDSTSATDSDTGLVGSDYKGFFRIEPLLSKSFDTSLDVNVALRTHTHGITPNAVMAAIDDGDRLMQLCFFQDVAAPKISYGGRSLPSDFSPYSWDAQGGATASMVGHYLKIDDTTTSDGLVYSFVDNNPVSSDDRVIGDIFDYMFEFRVKVLTYTPDMTGFCGVHAAVDDGLRSVGIFLSEVSGVRRVGFHVDGIYVGAQFPFEWNDLAFHTYRVVKNTGGDLVSLFADGDFLGSLSYSSFVPVLASPPSTGLVFFGSSTPLSVQAKSSSLWAYANFWRVVEGRKFVGLWKGSDPTSLTGYHLPVRASGHASIAGNSLFDTTADFLTDGVTIDDQLVIDVGPNKGIYTVSSVTPTSLTVNGLFPSQPSEVYYRIAFETDWTVSHRYRMVKDPSGGVAVYLDATTQPLIRVDYNSVTLPSHSVGISYKVANGLPAIVWGALDPTNLSQSAWDYVRYGAVRSLAESGIVPHHQVLNQRNIMASFEHHRTNIPHDHTDFWSESEGIPPQTIPDLLRDPNLVAYTQLNDSTPLVPSTQSYEVRRPTPVVVPVAGLNNPSNLLGDQGFLTNDGQSKVFIVVPDDILYNSLEVIESDVGSSGLLAPFDDECEPEFGSIFYHKTVCLTYDATTLPENDSSASTPWVLASDAPGHVTTNVSSGVLTYGTDSTGTKTVYRNATPLTDATWLHTEVKFRLKVDQDSTGGLGDSQVRLGFSSPGVTVGLGFVTNSVGERYVLVIDMNTGQTVGGISFDFYDGSFHEYRLVRTPGRNSIQIYIDS